MGSSAAMHDGINNFGGPGAIRLAGYVNRRISVCFHKLSAAPAGIILASGSDRRKLGSCVKSLD